MEDHGVWLAVMAIALAVMAIVQVVVLIVVAQAARRGVEAMVQVQKDLRPLIERANRLTEDASRITSLTLRQVERVDELMETLSERIQTTADVIQTRIVEPIQQGTALLAGAKAMMSLVGRWFDRGPRPAREDDEGLFI